MDIRLSFTDKRITPWRRMILMKKLLDRTGITNELIVFELPIHGSNSVYSLKQLVT